jgi:hypothetical protein
LDTVSLEQILRDRGDGTVPYSPLIRDARGKLIATREPTMRLSLKVLAPAVLLAAGLAMSSAEAAPAASGLTPLKGTPEASSMAEETRWVKRCYRHRHGVRCHRVWVQPRHHRHHHHRHHHHRHHRR